MQDDLGYQVTLHGEQSRYLIALTIVMVKEISCEKKSQRSPCSENRKQKVFTNLSQICDWHKLQFTADMLHSVLKIFRTLS